MTAGRIKIGIIGLGRIADLERLAHRAGRMAESVAYDDCRAFLASFEERVPCGPTGSGS